MKATFDLDVKLIARLKREAARRRCSISQIVEVALRMLFRPRGKGLKLPVLPRFNSGGQLVDIADRDALYRVMDEEDPIWASYKN